MDHLFALGGDLTSRIGAQIVRTSELTRQKLSNADDKTELPEYFVQLQQRIKALEKAHARMLKVTSHFDKETYDYPTDLRETFTDMSRTVVGAVNSTVNRGAVADGSAGPLPSAFLGSAPGPKTFAHALSRAAADSAMFINSAPLDSKSEPDVGSALAEALAGYAEACAKIGDARRHQDRLIHDKVTYVWEALSRTSIRRSLEVGQNVESARLELDATKFRTKGGLFGIMGGKKPQAGASGAGYGDDNPLSEEHRLSIEEHEAILDAEVTDAESVMRSVMRMPDSLQCLCTLVEAQQQFHVESARVLAELLPSIQALVKEQQAAETEHQRMQS